MSFYENFNITTENNNRIKIKHIFFYLVFIKHFYLIYNKQIYYLDTATTKLLFYNQQIHNKTLFSNSSSESYNSITYHNLVKLKGRNIFPCKLIIALIIVYESYRKSFRIILHPPAKILSEKQFISLFHMQKFFSFEL